MTHQEIADIIANPIADFSKRLRALERVNFNEVDIAAELLVPALYESSRAESPMLREATVDALSKYLEVPGVKETLHMLLRTNPSPGVRQAASDALDE